MRISAAEEAALNLASAAFSRYPDSGLRLTGVAEKARAI